MLRSWWPLLLLLGLQLGALAVLPFRPASARSTGEVVRLRTRAVDPFDLLAGRFVVLGYEVEGLVPDEGVDLAKEQVVWIEVERGEPAWAGRRVVSVPGESSAGRRYLRARWSGGRTSLVNCGRLYLPEAQALEADELLRDAPDRGIVDLAVDSRGNASPLRLWIGDRVFPPR